MDPKIKAKVLEVITKARRIERVDSLKLGKAYRVNRTPLILDFGPRGDLSVKYRRTTLTSVNRRNPDFTAIQDALHKRISHLHGIRVAQLTSQFLKE